MTTMYLDYSPSIYPELRVFTLPSYYNRSRGILQVIFQKKNLFLQNTAGTQNQPADPQTWFPVQCHAPDHPLLHPIPSHRYHIHILSFHFLLILLLLVDYISETSNRQRFLLLFGKNFPGETFLCLFLCSLFWFVFIISHVPFFPLMQMSLFLIFFIFI